MIKFLPEIYPDESIYSYLCRLYVQSGFIWHRGFANEVFSRWNDLPDYNFINALNEGFRANLEEHFSFKKLIIENTLFPFYARFLPIERRIKAYSHIVKNKPLIHKFLPIPCDKKDYYLKYCPMCVVENRRRYGESYFHIQHQIPSVHLCALHGCKLINTVIPNIKQGNSIMKPLEQLISENGMGETIKYADDNINLMVIKYIDEVFHQPLSLETEVLLSEYLTVNLNSKYVSPRGEQRNLVELDGDMAKYFDGLTHYDITKQRLAQIFRNNSFNPYDILLIAMFEGITPSALCTYEGYIEPKHVTFDREVRALRTQGKSYEKIGKIMGVNKEVARQIIIGTYDKPKIQGSCTPYRCQKLDWTAIDDECCKEFKNKLNSFLTVNPDGSISKKIVAGWFGLKDKTLRNLPRLRGMIRAYKMKSPYEE